MPATYVETIHAPAADLHPYPGAAKQHDATAMTESLQDNGQYRSVVARRLPSGALQILAGHGTTTAIADTGTLVRVEVIACTSTEARRIVLIDNAMGARAGYDETALVALLDAANADGGLAATGYDERAYQDLIASVRPRETPDNVDDIPDPPADPVTPLGGVWTLGQHRLVCGSGLDPDVIDQALNGQPVAAVHVDPPYGINIVKADGSLGDAKGYKPVIGDSSTATAANAFTDLTDRYPNAVHIWWGANHYAHDADIPNASCWLVWDKQNAGTDFADAELAWTNHPGAVRLFTHRWMGAARASETGPRFHPNQKPVILIRWALDTIANYAIDTIRDITGNTIVVHRTGVVLDVCAGSGPTLLAAELLGWPCAAIELDPAYCDVIAHRWHTLTGGPLVLDGVPVDPMRLSPGA